MIVVGFGSNIGDRLAHCREALRLLRAVSNIDVIAVSPVYASDALLPPNAPDSWNAEFYNAAVLCRSVLSPQDFLSALHRIEKQIGRERYQQWSPRVIDLDILLWGNDVISDDGLEIPHKHLSNRPFALWPAMDVFSDWAYPKATLENWGSRFSGQAPYRTRQMPYRLEGTKMVGIVNVTPDSFSDGGLCFNPDNAIRKASELIESGAEVIDLGAESTRPGAVIVMPQQEWTRLSGVISALRDVIKSTGVSVSISVDTRYPTTATHAIEAGADWINNVEGFSNPAFLNAVKDSNVKLVSMHSISIPPSQARVLPLDKSVIVSLQAWFRAQEALFNKAKIALDRVIIDPGVGFGKTPEQNFELIRAFKQLKGLGFPILVGHSRKSFLQILTDKTAPERDLETAILSAKLFAEGVDYLRVHCVESSIRAIRLMQSQHVNTAFTTLKEPKQTISVS